MQYVEALRFVENLHYYMEQKSLTKYRLAQLIPCSQSTVANWLNGAVPRGVMRSRLLEVLNVTEHELFYEDKSNPAPIARGGEEINPRYFDLSAESQDAVNALIERLALIEQAKAGQ